MSVLLRARFDAGAVSVVVVVVDFLVLLVVGPVESSAASSPEASRDEGWSSVELGWGTGR